MVSARLPSLGAQKIDSKYVSLLAAAALLAILPFEIDHLIFMLVGAAAYLVLYKLQSHSTIRPKQKGKYDLPPRRGAGSRRVVSPTALSDSSAAQSPKEKDTFTDTGQLKKTITTAPVVAPLFGCAGWEAEVNELLRQITPTPQCDKTVAQIATLVKRVIAPSFPEADVSSFVCGNINGGKAFGVAVPEVDIVIHVDPASVAQRRNHVRNQTGKDASLDARALQKYTMRVCTEKLVLPWVGLKFRRTAYRGDEPKATFLAPASLGFCETSVPIDVSVNTLAPFYNAALLTECGQLEPRARALILLVRRWAKDRGICHASKNHLPPYVWTILTIYFLQVGDRSEGALLPALEEFQLSSELVKGKKCTSSNSAKWKQAEIGEAKRSAGLLFKDFVHFYETQFDWRNEAVSIRTSERKPPSLDLPLHIIVNDDGTQSEVGPSIEDPFQKAQNLGDHMNASSMKRLKEEFTRAEALCQQSASLTELLEPWVPVDTAERQED